MNSKTKKITALVVSTVAVIAIVVTLLIGTPAYSTGETVETTNSVAITTETMTTQTMTETTTSTAEITTTTATTILSSSTSTTTTTISTTSTSLTTSMSTFVASKSTSPESFITKKTEETIKNTQPFTKAPIINEAVATRSEQPVVNSPVETIIKESSNTEETTEISKTTTETVIETEPLTTNSSVVNVKSNEELAQEVIHGLWGNGEDRVKRLTDAGYDYNAVQKIVNEIMKSVTLVTTPVEGAGITYVKNFSRGTYYAYGGPRKGGSQRQLIDCSIGDGAVKGSIASSYLYRNYGYNYNGKRTMVYLEIIGYPQMNGYYYLDDCDAGNPNVIDFFFLYGSNCPFQRQGVVQVDCYIVN